MSDAIFPVTPGLTFPVKKSPEFSTIINTADGGGESRIAKWSAPKWHYELIYEFLRDGSAYLEQQQLLGFFLARQGKFDSFLFFDPTDNKVSNQVFGVGDGTTTQFQLVRNFGGAFVEPVRGITAAPTITEAGNATTAFTWVPSGLVTFTSAPAAGAVLAWSGVFFFRLRFDMDKADFEQFMSGLWEVKSLQLVTPR